MFTSLVVAALLLSAPAAPPAPAGEKQATAFLDTWAAAQNKGDAAAYEALYATAFEGVRRSGKKATTFDRAGWIADRKKMFAKPMQVAVEKPVVTASGDKTVVRFTQTWASGSYRDTGTKELVLVNENGALRIAREEMLTSKVLPRLLVKVIVTPTTDDDSGVDIEVSGTLKRTYSMGIGVHCNAGITAGAMPLESRMSVSCGEGDCGTDYWIERKGAKLAIGETSGCQVGDDGSSTETVHETLTIPSGADVVVELEERPRESD